MWFIERQEGRLPAQNAEHAKKAKPGPPPHRPSARIRLKTVQPFKTILNRIHRIVGFGWIEKSIQGYYVMARVLGLLYSVVFVHLEFSVFEYFFQQPFSRIGIFLVHMCLRKIGGSTIMNVADYMGSGAAPTAGHGRSQAPSAGCSTPPSMPPLTSLHDNANPPTSSCPHPPPTFLPGLAVH